MATNYYFSIRLESERRVRDFGMLLDSKDQLIFSMHNFAEKLGIDCAISTPEKEIVFATGDDEMSDYLCEMEAMAGVVGKNGNIWCVKRALHATQDEHIDCLLSEMKKLAPSTHIEVLES